ncbi:hypothetical protein SAMN04488589_2344 [Methanolobus vulcani]|uniref:Uncharacterized protein n=1 Tax=Methanolobus vulcani TaxID=38026 RepID=A0A7Z7AY84_9EURY|nr:hypothetical protein [Methanolobus vulcani]SDG17015.1 hypothetical protein SAMN04488589_2344 [Methanolobus vulcani]
MKIAYKIAGGLLVSFLFLYVLMPFLIVGTPTSFYQIKNIDTVDHKITVEIFDPQNQSIHKKDYYLSPGQTLEKAKPPVLVAKTYFIDEECGCRVKSTLDDNSSVSLYIDYNPWNEPYISISENGFAMKEHRI